MAELSPLRRRMIEDMTIRNLSTRAARRDCFRMSGTAPGSATRNAGDGKAVSENSRRGIENGRVGLYGRSLRPARRIPRGPESDIACEITFRGRRLTGSKPNGKCRLMI